MVATDCFHSNTLVPQRVWLPVTGQYGSPVPVADRSVDHEAFQLLFVLTTPGQFSFYSFKWN